MILARSRFREPLPAQGFSGQLAADVGSAAEASDETGAGEENERKGPEDPHRNAASHSKSGSISSA
jgi:hypothetical protein